MDGLSAGPRGLQLRTAVVAVLVCAANLAFVMLALELAAFFLELVIVELVLIPDWVTVGPEFAALAAFLRDSQFWRSPAVVPLTAAFMLAQYEYVSRRPIGTWAVYRSSTAAKDLRARLGRLSQQVGVPAPDAVVADKPRPNSYTVGRRGNATVVVTRPLIDALDDDELDAVLAHELSHVVNRDATVMTMAVAPVRLARAVGTTLDRAIYGTGVTLYVIMMVGLVLVTLSLFPLLVYKMAIAAYDTVVGVLPVVGSGPVLPASITDPVAATVFGIAGTVFDGIVNVGAVLLLLALFAVPPLAAVTVYYVVLGPVPRLLARYREFAADRAAARITGAPGALAGALETLSGDPRPDEDYRRVGAVGELCLLPGGIDDDTQSGPIRRYIAEERPRIERLIRAIPVGAVAHPETTDRIERLREMARARRPRADRRAGVGSTPSAERRPIVAFASHQPT